ncbi:MAG: GNAT family N-acetyltransferase [Gemmatimonadaceae bacterium]
MARRKVAERLAIREIRTADDSGFARAHRLLRDSFPRSEMQPQGQWRTTMRERAQGLWTDIDWHLLVAERGRALLGAASGSYLGNVNVGLIGYVAIRPRERSSGIGLRLRKRLRQIFERDALRVTGGPLAGIVGEVRADNPWLRYLVRREGVIALDFPYFQPSMGKKHKPVPLVLYYQPMGTRRKSLSAAELRRLLYTMWRRMYRVSRPLSRPEFRRMIRSLDGRRRMGQRALD